VNNESLTYNEWADFWRYNIGLNVIPADSRNKRTYARWSQWQDEGVDEEQHMKWKKDNSFSNGIAIMPGKLWHKEDLKDHYLCFIDLDNEKAIEEVCVNVFGVKDIRELAQMTIVEQHLDNKSKAHVYFYTKHILKKKSSDVTKLKDKIDGNEIPAIEVKGLGEHGIAMCAPSVHKDGCNYEIISIKEPGIFEGKGIEDKLLEIYKKYGLLIGNESRNGETNKILMEELLKPDFIIEEGHNRHEAVLRVIEYYYLKYREYKPLDEISDISWKWNLSRCNPPISKSDFDRQLSDGIRFVDKTNVNNNQKTILLQRQNQYEQQLKTDSQIIYKIADCKGNVVKVYYIDDKSGQICYGVLKDYGINLEKCIIDIAPKKIQYYFNPLFPDVEPKVELEFKDGSEIRKLGPYSSISELLKALEGKGYILNRNKAADAFNSVVSAMKEKGNELVEYITDVTTSGYYLLDDKLVVKNISQSNDAISKEDAAECCNLLDTLSAGWKNKNIFPTVIKWGLISPFSFIVKSNSEDYMPYLQMYGWGKSGKTTLGMLVSMIWNRSTKLKKGFSNIDTIPRLGETISKDTYPVLVNEVGSLYETGRFSRYKPIRETIKHGVESTTVRGKFIDNRYEEIPALSPLILTSNFAPNNDGGFGRRFISIHFPKDEKKEADEEENFKKLLQEKKQYLKVLGDFTMQYICKDPSIFSKNDWKEIAMKILIEFYQYAGKEVPEWVKYFIEQKDAVDESNEKTMFALRAFFVAKINSAYSSNTKNSTIYTTITEKLEYCVNYHLIPFLHRTTIRGGSGNEGRCDTIVITHDILDEINSGRNNIENITALKDIAVQLGFTYDGKYLNGKKTKVVFGPISKLIEFVNPEIVSEDDGSKQNL
jgi:hypothetical protein